MRNVSNTISGKICQRWDVDEPHTNQHQDVADFPPGTTTLSDAENYCRNPSPALPDGPWCYTKDPNEIWGYCDIPLCNSKLMIKISP